MKKIVLVDDDIKKMTEIFGKIFKMLWKGKDEEGIASEVIFFGDYFKLDEDDSDLQKENIDSFSRMIKYLLISHCEDEELWESEGEMYREKKKLIDNLARNISLNNEKISNMVKIWSNKELLSDENNLTEETLKPLIDLILERKESEEEGELYILLDVILLSCDKKQVEEGIPIISMGLYNALKESKYTCFLYSSFAYDYLLIEKYREIYKERYGKDITIYPSKDFFSENVNSEKCLFYHLNK